MPDLQPVPRLTPLERLLKLFTDVRPGEGTTGAVMLLNIFLILAAYYFIKPVREGWLAVSVIKDLSKIEVKAYSSFGQSLVLLAVVPLYAQLAAWWSRRQLVNRVTLFFIANLIMFWILQPGWLEHGIPYVGVAFYLWVGIFSVTVVMQFWAFAADVYSDERGRRIFPVIAVGGSAGSVVGSWLSQEIVNRGVETFNLLLLAIIPLALAFGLTWLVDARGAAGRLGNGRPPETEEPAAPDPRGAFEMVFGHRYLLAVAGFALLVNWVNTNGENILFGVVQQGIEHLLAEEGIAADSVAAAAFIKRETTAFYGNLYFWVNLCSLLVQALLVSRIIKFGGFVMLVLLTPAVSFFSYTLMALFPVLMVIKVMKIAENSANYSANNTARHVLWLPAPRAMIYKAKAAIDTLFARTGDGLAAVTVLVGAHLLHLTLTTLLVFNVVLVLAWGALCVLIAREYRRMKAAGSVPGEQIEAPPAKS